MDNPPSTISDIEDLEDAKTERGERVLIPDAREGDTSSADAVDEDVDTNEDAVSSVLATSDTDTIGSGLGVLPRAGQVLFERYLVQRQLGQGGMGTVWLVKHLGLDSDRALKLIVSGIALDPQARARFLREARVMDRLNHPNAVRVYEVRLAENTAFIEMEYVKGRSLDDILEPGIPKPVEWVADLLDQLCDVLQAAMDEGIIHRDLKPSNLMISEGRVPGKFRIKLFDFGLAKLREGSDDVETVSGCFVGTAYYASPEQVKGEPLDARSDLYSAGVLLYELLTGHRPFRGSAESILYQHAMTPPPTFASINPQVTVPPAVERVVMKCLAKSPRGRPRSPRELAEMFRRALTAPNSGDSLTASLASVVTRATTSVIAGTPPGILGTAPTVTAPPMDAPLVLPPGPPAAADASESTLHTYPGDAAVGMVRDQIRRRKSRLRRVLYFAVALGLGVLATVVAVSQPGIRSQILALTVSSRQKPDDEQDPPVQPEPVPPGEGVAGLKERWIPAGFTEDEASGTSGEWPKVLLRKEDQYPFHLIPEGIYLPEGYSPKEGPNPVDGMPWTLVRQDGTTFIRIAGGAFRMGCLDTDVVPADDYSRPPHQVTLSGYYIQATEVTNDEIRNHLGEIGPRAIPRWKVDFDDLVSRVGSEEVALKHPATGIPWAVASDFARKRGGQLPSEAQWEFAARSRGKDFYHVWDHLGDPGEAVSTLANLANPDGSTAAVGSFPRDLTVQGVHDMAGNVREWCRDVWQRYGPEPADNPVVAGGAAEADERRVIRGGSFESEAKLGHTTNRDEPGPAAEVSPSLGFRIVIECPAIPGRGRGVPPSRTPRRPSRPRS